MSKIEPSKEQLAACNEEVRAGEFYSRMLEHFGEAAANRPASRDEVWSLAQILLLHLKGLNAAVADLKAQPNLKYAGVWKPDTAYGKGTLITDHGSLWYANNATCERPPGGEWRLMAKRGSR